MNKNSNQNIASVDEAMEKLYQFMAKNGLKRTHQRDLIAKVFFENQADHHTIEDILQIARNEDSSISYTTVYRTLMVLTDAGLATQNQFGKGHSLFEASLGDHHDHLVCTECDKIIEFENPTIENLQEDIAKQNGFRLTHHKMELYGICETCQAG